MNDTVENFYLKNPAENYIDTYESQHGERLDKMVDHFKLKNVKDSVIADLGGGLGFLGKRLDPSNEYIVIDGANIPEDKKLCKGEWVKCDLDIQDFSDLNKDEDVAIIDVAFCLEVAEHLSNPYRCLENLKRIVKEDGLIYISIPTPDVWHNTIYPGLIFPKENFIIFLNQMALPVVEFWQYDPSPGKGWPSYHFKCRNANWIESKMLFHKTENKFRGVTPLEATNL